MRDDYLQNALKVISEPYILVNVVSLRVKQLKRGYRPLVVSLEKLAVEDVALREIAEGKISYQLASPEELARRSHKPVRNAVRRVSYAGGVNAPVGREPGLSASLLSSRGARSAESSALLLMSVAPHND